jgi:hypothetical protein
LFNIGLPADFHAERLPEDPLESARMTRSRPELELGVARRSELQERIVAAIVELDAGDRL